MELGFQFQIFISPNAVNVLLKTEKIQKNVQKIANAKKMMFGEEEWHRCPCDGQNADRYCISELCRSDIERDGECHCHCYCKKVG